MMMSSPGTRTGGARGSVPRGLYVGHMAAMSSGGSSFRTDHLGMRIDKKRRLRYKFTPGGFVLMTSCDLPSDDPKQRQPDIALAREALDWAPTVALRDGLEKTIAYFDGLLAETR